MIGTLARTLARRRLARLRALALDPEPAQRRVFATLLDAARRTAFGREHGLDAVRDAAAWAAAVPLRDYAGLAPWWDRARAGEANVSWPGHVRYWAISSGTTAGEKYLPVSEDTIRGNRQGGLDALVGHLARGGDLFGGKLLFLGGSTSLRREGPSWIGDNTGIMTQRIPRLLRRWHTPGREVAAIGDWEAKIDATVRVAVEQDVRLLAGVPSWIILFAERVLERVRAAGREAQHLRDVWPNLGLFVHGGMSFAPYRDRFLQLAGPGVECVDTYSASEGGQLAVQDEPADAGMIPLVDQGVFFEFVEPEEIAENRPTRVALHEVEPDRDYAVVLNTDSGIWGYLVGDVVRFTSVRPYRLRFQGRLAHTLNAFGEHVSGGELDRAVLRAAEALGAPLREYAVAARYPDAASPVGGHVYYVEFAGAAADPLRFAEAVDRRIAAGNEDYAAHREGDLGIAPPRVRAVSPGTFYAWMKRRGKIGGQHKVPRVLTAELEASLGELLRAAPYDVT